MSDSLHYQFDAIGIVHSCYTEKFGIPRQPGLVDAEASIELLPPYNRAEAVKGLDGFSHIWVSFVFHGVRREQWRPTVRPPRLGGNERLGVFATRSTHRPNPLGLSVVALTGVECAGGRVILHLKGADLLDGTPVLDIKPYIPYVDSVPEAHAGFAAEPPISSLRVIFSEAAEHACRDLQPHYPQLRSLIIDVLAQDPRPAYQADCDGERRIYGFKLYDLNIRFYVEGGEAVVITIDRGR
jgi:tRNA-Thr(GGU) m(6)t(6)A37 methyltransferase TsaA